MSESMSDTWNPGLAGLLAERRRGVLATIRRDGRPQLSNVAYKWDAGPGTIRVSVTDDRAKTRNLRRDPRAVFHATSADGWAYTVADAVADLSPVTTSTDDEAADALVRLYRDISGEHPDWDEFRTAMVDERRLVLTLQVERLYGSAPARQA
ncbi:MAG: PPOX class F420-dependent oxidoreductase [Nocardioidaceae bacterium]